MEVDGKTYDCAYIELGVPGLPHAAVRLDELDTIDDDTLRTLGRKLRWHSAFPKGANVNFYKITGPDQILERTFERGVEDVSKRQCMPRSAAATSKLQRVRVLVFSKIRAMFLPAQSACGTPAFFFALSSAASVRSAPISSGV